MTSSTGWPISCHRHGSTGTACRLETSQGCSPRITSSGAPSRRMTKGNVGKRRDAATSGHAVDGNVARGDATGDCCDSCDKPRSHDTSRRKRPNSWPGWAEEFPLECPGCGGDIRLRGDRRQEPARFEARGSQAEEAQDGFARVKPAPHTPRRTARASARLSRPSPDELPAIDIQSLRGSREL